MANEVSIPTGLAINAANAAERTSAQGMRRVLSLLFKQSAPMVPVPGRLGTEHLVVSARADMKYDISAGGAVTTRPSQGAYVVGSVSPVTVDTDAASGTNPRIDRIYIVQPDPELSESGVARIGVVCGAPAASPTLPALPPGALELARKVIGPTATRTNEGAAFTDQAPVTGLSIGGVLGINSGGTGATTPAAALEALGIYIRPESNPPPYADNRVWIVVP